MALTDLIESGKTILRDLKRDGQLDSQDPSDSVIETVEYLVEKKGLFLMENLPSIDKSYLDYTTEDLSRYQAESGKLGQFIWAVICQALDDELTIWIDGGMQ